MAETAANFHEALISPGVLAVMSYYILPPYLDSYLKKMLIIR